LADPSSPVELSSVPISHVGYGIARSGDLLASTGQQFSVLDASGLGDPELVGLLDLDCYAVDLAADDSLGLIVGWTRESGYFLRAVDFHDPVNPVLLGTDSLPSNEVGILVRDSVGYVATETGLYIRDLLHPGLPVIGAAATSMRPRRLALRDSLCFVSGDRLRVFSMADPDSIRLVGDTAVEAVDLAIEDTILVAVRQSGGAILSISDPAHPRWLASLSAQNSRAVALADTLLIVGCVDRIDVWSVADPSQPRRLGVSWVEENVSDIDFHEDMVYTNLVRCYRLDIIPQGIQEPGFEPAGQPSVTPLVASHELYLRGPGKASLTDISGRKVMDLAPGQNDIRHIAPGVYFLRPAESGERPAVRKVVIQR
jgi:hypothetical protein